MSVILDINVESGVTFNLVPRLSIWMIICIPENARTTDVIYRRK